MGLFSSPHKVVRAVLVSQVLLAGAIVGLDLMRAPGSAAPGLYAPPAQGPSVRPYRPDLRPSDPSQPGAYIGWADRLAVAVAAHAGLFNIGAEGQATLGGLGVALVCLALPWPHWALALPAAMLGGALFGAAWALIPAWLQAKRGSHVVITTIMFNFIAAALLNWLLVNVMRPAGSMDPATARFPAGTTLPTLSDMAAAVGMSWGRSTPANITFLIAVAACVLVWVLIWRTPLGYEIRAFGKSEPGAVYAGINPVRITVIAMLISGALAGLMAINNVMGESERLVLNAVEGAGFIGIAVALMGRNHPLGILLAGLLLALASQLPMFR